MYTHVRGLLLLVSFSVCSAAIDPRHLVDAPLDQNMQLAATIGELRAEISELRQKYDILVASTIAQRNEQAMWQRDILVKLQSLVGGGRRYSTAQRRRRLSSSDTCAEEFTPQLVVKGVCSCTDGLLAQGRNVTQELDSLLEALSTTTSTSTSTSTTTSSSTTTTSTSTSTSTTTSTTTTPCVVDLQVAGSVSVGGSVHAAAVSPNGTLALAMGFYSSQLYVVNLAIPAQPQLVGSVQDSGTMYLSYAVNVLDNQYAVVTGYGSNSIAVVDYGTNSASPAVAAYIVDSTNLAGARGAAVSPDGTTLFVGCASSDSLTVINVTDPVKPKVLSRVTDTPRMEHPTGLAIGRNGRHVFVAGYKSNAVAAVSVENVSNPTVVGSVSDSSLLSGIFDVAASPTSDFVYTVSSNTASFGVVNVSEPKNPQIVGSIAGDTTNMNSAYSVKVSHNGRRAFVIGRDSNSFVAIDISDPVNPYVIDAVFSSEMSNTRAVALSHDSTLAIAGGFSSNKVVTIHVCS